MNKDGDGVQQSMVKLGENGKSPEPPNKLDTLMDQMAVPGPNEEAFFEERRRKGLGVGLDGDGNLVGANDSANRKPSAHEDE
ncbi:hypothetical protein HCG46_15175 [Labrenzia sp. PO1]|uniref:hypothetical protein n=1 Tax=Labrenzia sp. PO1 TaxID=2720390 RepID=UPI0014473ED8|nr:hypothetical protein [Labrenzia sp. PO1]NKI59614.1 hypothetical protein [Labrenzia sp. PO1]